MTIKTFLNNFSFSRGFYSLIDPDRSQKEILEYSQSFLTFHYIRLKLYYLFLFAAYCSFSFLSLFFSTVFLLPKSLIGILLSVTPFVSIFSSPCWSILADRHDAHRKIMLSCTTCIIFVTCSLPFMGKYFGFGGLFITLVVYSLCDGGVWSLIDNLTINVLSRKGDFAEFGRQRLFGSLSNGISIVILGFVIDRFNSLYIMFFSFGLFMGLLLLVVYLTPPEDFKIDHHDELITDDMEVLSLEQLGPTPTIQVVDTNIMTTTTPPFMKSFLHLITKPRLLLFLFALLSMHTVKSSTSSFLYVFLSEDLKADAKLLGLSSFTGITLEVLCFYFGKQISESTFPEVMIILGGLISTLRSALYAFFGAKMNPWFSLPIETCQGVEFALVKPASLEIITQLSPPRLRATALGILAATESLSTGLGQILGGFLYGNFGAIKMFLYLTWIGLFAIIFYITGLLLQKRRLNK